MALDTFDNLKIEIIEWSHRSDLDLKISVFIQMAEQEMFSNSTESLQLRGSEARAETVTTGKYLALPGDYQSVRSIRIITDAGHNELLFRTPEQMDRRSGTGKPCQFSITSQIEFDITPDQAYTVEMQYFAKPTPLSSSNATNEVLDNFPTIYLFGTLWALFNYAVDEAEAGKYYAQFISAIRGANKIQKRGRYGPAPVMTLEGATP